MSDEYTPTTDDVRDGFANSYLGDGTTVDPGVVVQEQLGEFDRWLIEHDKRMKADGWGEACQALAWCFDSGPERDALPYLIEHNPFAASIEESGVES